MLIKQNELSLAVPVASNGQNSTDQGEVTACECGKKEKEMAQEIDAATRQRAFKHCKELLGGSWARIPMENLIIRPVSGGLSNYIYKCSLPDDVTPAKGELSTVLFRIYGKMIQESMETVIVDNVIFALLSERRLGPKLFGLFPGGRLEEYIPSRCLSTAELSHPAFSIKIAQIMADFHSLNMPISKRPKWLFALSRRWVRECQSVPNSFPEGSEKSKRTQALLDHDLDGELNWLKSTLEKLDSPVAFCHNDLQEGNLLFFGSAAGEFTLMPIDFEYCSYNYRGFDIANHFCEWAFDYHCSEPPYFKYNPENLPSREQQMLFIQTYLESRSGVFSEDEVDKILIEAQYFALASHLFWTAWSIVQSQESGILFDYVKYGECRFQAYQELKRSLPPLLLEETANGHESDK